MHALGFAHCDLKPRNLVLCLKDENVSKAKKYCVPSNLEIFQNCKKIKNLTKYLILKGKINYFHDF